MRLGFVIFALFLAPAGALNAATLGVSINGTCIVGSCPATPLAFNSTETLQIGRASCRERV